MIPNDKAEITLKGVKQWANCWYRAGRIYIFGVSLDNFESAMIAKDPNNISQVTTYHDTNPVTCFLGTRGNQATSKPGTCYTGVANSSFAADAPAQLAEYTFDSDFPDSNPAENTPPADTGIPMADIDVSSVDDLYLPIAASVYNHGATGYMGAAMKLDVFKKRVQSFWCQKNPPPNDKTCTQIWPIYSAYKQKYWPKNTFSDLMPAALGGPAGTNILEHLPAGYNIINNTLGRPRSPNYFPGGNDPHYLISNVDVDQKNRPVNPVMQKYINRWLFWLSGTPCADKTKLVWPDNITAGFDKDNFCQKFRDNIRAVWDHFENDPVDGFRGDQGYGDKDPKDIRYHHNNYGFYSDCGLYDVANKAGLLPPDSKGALDGWAKACIIMHIVGYNSNVLAGDLPGRVQAALRGVAYDPSDKGRQYQFDPFLTFAAPYNSQFNVDPFTRLIHSTKDGVGAVAYSFSIDDKYGNFRDASSGFIVDAGGVSALENQTPYDPYQIYKAIWGYNQAEYILVWLADGTKQADIQAQLINISAANGNRGFLIKQGSELWLLAQTPDDQWTWVDLASQAYLQTLADKEKEETKGKQDYFQQLIAHTFGDQSVFPKTQLNVDSNAITFLKWDSDTGWNLAKLKLYELVIQKGSFKSTVNNWVKANLCGHSVDIHTAGGNNITFPFASGVYKPCDITLTDVRGDELVLRLNPVKSTVKDTYTGANVVVWGLPHGKSPEGDPPTSHKLSEQDRQYCRTHSSQDLVTLGTCDLIGVSANWTNDRFARDTVYMGLDPKDMPRVNLNLPVAPVNEVDPEAVYFPSGSKITVTKQSGNKVTVKWPAALVKSKKPVKYELTLWKQVGPKPDPNDKPTFQSACAKDKDQHNQPINLNTFCQVEMPADAASSKWYFYVIGINYSANKQPLPQTDPLYSDTFNYPQP